MTTYKAQVTTKEASEYLGCSVGHITYLIRSKVLKAQKDSHNFWMVDFQSLKKYSKEPQETGFPRGQKR